LHIRKLEGEWSGYMRMTIGKIRIIFKIEKDKKEIDICEIDFRGNIY
jgi:mRNA interferase RelE/StbE